MFVSSKLDLLGDHPYTNYRDAYLQLQRLGYTVELLRKPWACFDAALYSVLLLSDPEEELAPAEVSKLEDDVRRRGLSVLVIADWYGDSDGEHIIRCVSNTRWPRCGSATSR